MPRFLAWIAFAGVCLIRPSTAQDLPAAISAFKNGRYDEAAAALSKILERTPDDAEANYYLGLTHFRAGRPKEARPFLERAIRLSPSNSSAWKGLGLILLGSNEFRAASAALSKACELAPNDEDGCYLLGRSLYLQGRYDEAVQPFEKALRAVPPASRAAAHRAAALNLVELGRDQDAERHFREAVRLYRAGAANDPRVDYGALLVRLGRAPEAVAMLRESVAAAPGSSRAHAELGRALLELDRPAEAASSLERAVELDPAAWAARLMLGKVYMRLGRTEEAKRELRLGREGWGKQDYGSSRSR